MKSDTLLLAELAVSFLPFILFGYLNGKVNVKKEVRYKQFLLPILAVIYAIVLVIFNDQLAAMFMQQFLESADLAEGLGFSSLADKIREIHATWGIYLELVLFNTASLLMFVVIKGFLSLVFRGIHVPRNTFLGSVVELFYAYDENKEIWYIKDHFGQACSFIKTAYYGSCVLSGLALLVSCGLCMNELVSAPFYPVFAVIIIGEMAFFIDGQGKKEQKSEVKVQADNSNRVTMYPMLRKPLRALFEDKLSAEGTTVNFGGITGGAVEDVLTDLEKNGGHVGKNYAAFIRGKMESGLEPNVDYVRCGYDLAMGKSLLFNTPFYDKLNPYVFYAMERELLKGGKVLIVLGRHGTEEDLKKWTEAGMQSMSNIPGIWKTQIFTGEKLHEDELPDIGIISRSGVHDLDIHKNGLEFLRRVTFVFVVEPSRLVTTAQIGLNLLIRCCGKERPVTFCSVDRNCDGLVDALSHILMTNITEVSATEYPRGMSSYMYWLADHDHLQHRILPGISRCLGMGTEISMVALKNQVNRTVWYGGETYPVMDARWIAKQYYYDLLDYAGLPTNQETFDKTFRTSFNMCDERVNDRSFITVEDDRNNLFETRRNFATIAQEQGFVNVISSEYMLREYMSENTELFTADAKAIPYITADYARTRRNAILSLCLLLCIDKVPEEMLHRQMQMLNIDTKDPSMEVWKEVCNIFSESDVTDKQGVPILCVKDRDGKPARFEKKNTIFYRRAYSIESGKYESVYTIEDPNFSRIILDDLQNASYIAEQDSRDEYIGTELKGHVYQKYMPGQFFTLNGKYYEMVGTATDDRILVRRASDHIGGRLSYRQVRDYTIHHLEDASSMGALKTVNNIDIHYQMADLSVKTPGYWKLRAYNDFDNGSLVKVNGVPERRYYSKQILRFDFSRLGDAFTDEIRMTLTTLLNEVFVTLFADNQPFICAVTPGSYEAPLTYSLNVEVEDPAADKCIFIVEDSQLDIGLLIAVERNVDRIFQIISDYLSWNDEMIAESRQAKAEPAKETEPFDVYAEDTEKEEKPKKRGLKGLFGKKKAKAEGDEEEELTPRQKRKRAKAAAKAAKKAEREQKKALKEAQKAEESEAEEQTESETSEQEESVQTEAPEENLEQTPAEETEETPAEEAETAEETEDASEEEAVEETGEETPDASEAEAPDREESEVEVSEDE